MMLVGKGHFKGDAGGRRHCWWTKMMLLVEENPDGENMTFDECFKSCPINSGYFQSFEDG